MVAAAPTAAGTAAHPPTEVPAVRPGLRAALVFSARIRADLEGGVGSAHDLRQPVVSAAGTLETSSDTRRSIPR